MKKFLFTLAALLLAGSAYATPDPNNPNYLYVPEFEITEDLMNEYGEIEIPVAAQVNYTAFAFQAEVLEIPQGLNFVDAYKGGDYTITYKNNRGRDAQSTQELFIAQPENMGFFGAQVEAGYWQAPGESAWTSYGAVKWEPGLYEEFVILVFEVDKENFQPGHIVINSTWNGNDPSDPREGVTIELWMDMPEIWSEQEGGLITLEGQVVPPPVTPAPEIVVTPGENAYTFEAVGEGEVKLYREGAEVDNPYTVERTTEDQIVKLTATAHVEGQTDGSVYGEYLVPALEVVTPVDPNGEIIISDPDENGVVTITYTGDEDDVTITVTVNGEEVVLGEDGTITVGEGESVIVVVVGGEGYNDLTETKTVTYTVTPPELLDLTGEIVVSEPTEDGLVTITYTGDEDVTITVNGEEYNGEEIQLVEGENTFVVVVSAEGYNDLDGTFVVVYTIPVPPVTPTPEITYEVFDEYVVITATGEGTITMTVDGVEVDNPYTVERGATDVVVVVTATAQGEDMLISETATMDITIPAIGGVEPEDPHMTGYWVVLIDKNGNEIWENLSNNNETDPNQFVTNVALHYSQYGGRPLQPGETDDINPLVPFYIVVDGVRYACAGENVEPVYGDANQNPLVESENFWNVPVGYFYTIGVLVDPENNNLLLQISKGVYTGIDEMNADKAIANVRYFNMAGQEMQEANGMTIVVTTYTDGTSSAVKVMK